MERRTLFVATKNKSVMRSADTSMIPTMLVVVGPTPVLGSSGTSGVGFGGRGADECRMGGATIVRGATTTVTIAMSVAILLFALPQFTKRIRAGQRAD